MKLPGLLHHSSRRASNDGFWPAVPPDRPDFVTSHRRTQQPPNRFSSPASSCPGVRPFMKVESVSTSSPYQWFLHRISTAHYRFVNSGATGHVHRNAPPSSHPQYSIPVFRYHETVWSMPTGSSPAALRAAAALPQCRHDKDYSVEIAHGP